MIIITPMNIWQQAQAEAFEILDETTIRDFARRWDEPWAEFHGLLFWRAVHLSRVNCRAISVEKQTQSFMWLREHGYDVRVE